MIDNRSEGVFQRIPIVPKKIHETIFYGHSGARRNFLATDKSEDNSMPCLTVDDLNESIGLSWENMLGNIGRKINCLNEVLQNGDSSKATEDQKDWIEWLKQRNKPLMLSSMNGKRCRADTGMDDKVMDDSWWEKMTKYLFPTYPHKIPGNNSKIWEEDDYRQSIRANYDGDVSNNVNYATNQQAKSQHSWTRKFLLQHDNYVSRPELSGKDFKLDSNNTPFTNVDAWIQEMSEKWFYDISIHFFRLTSKMGLDFFAHKKKHVAFIRNVDETDYYNDEGRRAITDSEWEHANKQGYIGDCSVTRLDPLHPSLEKKKK